jgi:hypothetical protein
MADHVLTLSDADEEALAWAVISAGGSTADAILRRYVDDGLGAAVSDLNKRLEGLGPLDAESQARVKRALLRQPEPDRGEGVRAPD